MAETNSIVILISRGHDDERDQQPEKPAPALGLTCRRSVFRGRRD